MIVHVLARNVAVGLSLQLMSCFSANYFVYVIIAYSQVLYVTKKNHLMRQSCSIANL